MTLGSSINSPEKRLKIYRLEISYVHDVLRLHFYLYLNFCKRSVGQLVFFTQLRWHLYFCDEDVFKETHVFFLQIRTEQFLVSIEVVRLRKVTRIICFYGNCIFLPTLRAHQLKSALSPYDEIVFSYFFHTLPELISSVTNIFAEITGAAGSSDKNVYTVQNF